MMSTTGLWGIGMGLEGGNAMGWDLGGKIGLDSGMTRVVRLIVRTTLKAHMSSVLRPLLENWQLNVKLLSVMMLHR